MDCIVSPSVGQGTCKTVVALLISGGNGEHVILLLICARSQVAPNVYVVTLQAPFLGGKLLPRASPSAQSLPITWNDNSSSSSSGEKKERQRRMRKTMKTASCVGYFPGCIVHSPLAEPWGEDTATFLTEGDGEESCAGVRSDSECSVELRERRFSSVHLEKFAQNSQKLWFTSASFACSGPRQERHLSCFSSTGPVFPIGFGITQGWGMSSW
ncbi:UNVERIFIED_CONTAM: hypothetical protein FKN15_009246 [Acipenser sinensis]